MILAKVIASLIVGAASMVIALVFGVAGNLVGPAITGTDRVWDVPSSTSSKSCSEA